MAKDTKASIEAQGVDISIRTTDAGKDYFSLTDIARYKNPDDPTAVIGNWMRLRNTVEYLGLWERLHNPNFKPLEFEGFMKDAGANAFTLSPQKWISTTNAIGIISKSGRHGGTYAFSDIAIKFAGWLSVEFEIYIVKDYQRLKNDEGRRLQLDWNVKRDLSKVNYKIHTDAIKAHLLPKTPAPAQISYTYASEGDLLNVALFDMTARQWRDKNPNLNGNMRDYADICQLIVLANLESMNAELIKHEVPQGERLVHLRKMASEQLVSLMDNAAAERLGRASGQKTISLKGKHANGGGS
jgi:hypothetical protein